MSFQDKAQAWNDHSQPCLNRTAVAALVTSFTVLPAVENFKIIG